MPAGRAAAGKAHRHNSQDRRGGRNGTRAHVSLTGAPPRKFPSRKYARFGGRGRHTRSAVGMAALPFDIAVEIALVARGLIAERMFV